MSQLTNYIQKELSKGFSKKQIKQKLLQAGYTDDNIKESFKSLDKGEPLLKRELDHIYYDIHVKWSKFVFPMLAIFVLFFLGYLVFLYATSQMSFVGEIEQKVVTDCDDECKLELEQVNCRRTDDYAGCLASLALKNNDPAICNGLDDCIATVAISLEDGSICEEYLSRSSGCANSYFEAIGDADYCTPGDLACGYDATMSDEEKKEFFAKQISTLDIDDSEYILSFAIENSESLLCQYYDEQDEILLNILAEYDLEAFDYCIFIVAYHANNPQICMETHKNSLCQEMIGCDDLKEDLCNALQ